MHNIVTMCARLAMSFFALSNALILQSYVLSWWNCIFLLTYRELSSGARVMELYRNRNVDPSRSPCLKAIDRKSFERFNFLVLRPALLKVAYFNSGILERRKRKERASTREENTCMGSDTVAQWSVLPTGVIQTVVDFWSVFSKNGMQWSNNIMKFMELFGHS